MANLFFFQPLQNSLFSRENLCNLVVAFICSELAASIADEESTREAILYLEKFGISTAGQDISEATNRVISSLRAVGELAAALTISSKEIVVSKSGGNRCHRYITDERSHSGIMTSKKSTLLKSESKVATQHK